MLLCAVSWVQGQTDGAGNDEGAVVDNGTQFRFYHALGQQVVDDAGNPARMRGVAFGNQVWSDVRIPTDHHGADDYARVAAMGMNLVRFYLNYKTLESDENPYTYLDDGWAWIDQNIEWARQNGVHLILNLHVPQGGFQSLGNGRQLWEDRELQKRCIALWRAIAKRYANEPVIFGYDLINEPGVTFATSQWLGFAQELIVGIRAFDRRHPIIVERVNSVNGKWDNDKQMNFVKVTGSNIIYTFHFYDPFSYTHQYAEWTEHTRGRDGGSWPEPRKGNSKDHLAKQLDKYLKWGRKNNVPLYLGEWGLYKANFEEGKGGLAYVSDMLDLIEERGLISTYHVYHEESFGLYRGNGTIDPANANQPLIDLFTQRYGQ